MIWICTLCLLALAVWLFFNALNERRWVEAHSHDESVASDKGLLPSFTTSTGTGQIGPDGKVSIADENSRFAKAVNKVQEKTAGWSEKYIESKVTAARITDDADRPASASEENTLFGRAVARVSESTKRMEQKFETKIKASGEQSATTAGSGSDESLVARTTRKVAATSEDIGQRVASGAKNLSQGFADRRSGAQGEGFFDRATKKVSSGLNTLDSKMTSGRQSSGNDEDLVSRVASKVNESMSKVHRKGDKPSVNTEDTSS